MREKEYVPISIHQTDDLLSSIEQANKTWMGPIPPTNAPESSSTLSSNVRTLLGVKRLEDWVLNLNIGNVMHLSPLTLQEMNLHLDNSHELTRDALLEKVILLAISYFCIGTELRFLSSNKKEKTKDYSKDDSEKW